MISNTQAMRRLLLDIDSNTIRNTFERHGHLVNDLDDSSLLDYAVAILTQEHDEELDPDLFNLNSNKK